MPFTEHENPDTRSLPTGWSQRYDEQQKLWFYIRDDVVPPIMSYVHPLGPRPVESPHRPPNGTQETARSSGDQSTIATSSTTRKTFAQQLYASALRQSAPPSSEPTPVGNTHRPSPEKGCSTHRDLDSHGYDNSSGSIDIDASKLPPPATADQNAYPSQLVAYLADSTNTSNYTNEHLSGSSHTLNTQPVPPPIPSPTPSKTSELGPSSPAAMVYTSVRAPQNPQSKSTRPHGPRVSSHSSRGAATNVQEFAETCATSPELISAPSEQTYLSDPSHGAPHRTRSYQPTPTSSLPATSLPRSSTFTAVGRTAPAPSHSSPIPGHQRATTEPAFLSGTSGPSPAPGVPPMWQMPMPQHHDSGSESATHSSYSSPPTSYTSSPTVFAPIPPGFGSQPSSYSFPPNVDQSPPTIFSSPTMLSLPPTPALTASTSSQPPTPLYSPMSPVQVVAPSRMLDTSQAAAKSKGFSRNTMLGLVGGTAAGILGGAVLNDVLGGDSDVVDGLVDGVSNMMGGNGDSGNGGIIDGMFNGGDGSDGVFGGDNGFQQFLDPSNGSPSNLYSNPSDQGSVPYFDPSDQGNGGGSDPTSMFDQPSQSNPYDQYQQQQQQQQQPHQSGPDLMHIAQQAYNKIHPTQPHQQSASSSGGFGALFGQSSTSGNASAGQQAAHQGGTAAGAGHTHQTHSQAPLGAYPQHNTYAGYQAAYNAYHNVTAHSQTSPHSQTYQSTQTATVYQSGHPYPPGPTYQGAQQGQQAAQHQGINATQVKQFAKGAMIATKILAKVNGVNLGN